MSAALPDSARARAEKEMPAAVPTMLLLRPSSCITGENSLVSTFDLALDHFTKGWAKKEQSEVDCVQWRA